MRRPRTERRWEGRWTGRWESDATNESFGCFR
jgi:hypothetical protein